MPLRAAAICGLLAPVTFILGLVLGDLAQSDDFSPANDNISDIGAQTADQAWLYNQIAANLTGLLIVFGAAIVLVVPSMALLYTLAQRDLVAEGEAPRARGGGGDPETTR